MTFEEQVGFGVGDLFVWFKRAVGGMFDHKLFRHVMCKIVWGVVVPISTRVPVFSCLRCVVCVLFTCWSVVVGVGLRCGLLSFVHRIHSSPASSCFVAKYTADGHYALAHGTSRSLCEGGEAGQRHCRRNGVGCDHRSPHQSAADLEPVSPVKSRSSRVWYGLFSTVRPVGLSADVPAMRMHAFHYRYQYYGYYCGYYRNGATYRYNSAARCGMQGRARACWGPNCRAFACCWRGSML